MGVFYVDNSMIGARESELLQSALNVLIGLFRRYEIFENVAKYRTMTYQPGALWSGISDEKVGQK